MFYCSYTAQIFLQNRSLRSAILPAVIFVMKITECYYNHRGYEVYVSIIMMSLFSHSNNYQGHHKVSTIIIYKTKQNFSEGVHMHVYMFECVCWCLVSMCVRCVKRRILTNIILHGCSETPSSTDLAYHKSGLLMCKYVVYG